MVSKRATIVISAAAFIAGALLAAFVSLFDSKGVPLGWFELTTPQGAGGPSYSIDAFNKSDILLPDVRKISGKAKFVYDTSTQSHMYLGYHLMVDIAPLDTEKIPDEYKREKKFQLESGRSIIQLPIDQVTYESVFEFKLMDKDGFVLLEVKSDPESVQSGKSNAFQALAHVPIPPTVASRTAQVSVSMQITKCVTCRGDR